MTGASHKHLGRPWSVVLDLRGPRRAGTERGNIGAAASDVQSLSEAHSHRQLRLEALQRALRFSLNRRRRTPRGGGGAPHPAPHPAPSMMAPSDASGDECGDASGGGSASTRSWAASRASRQPPPGTIRGCRCARAAPTVPSGHVNVSVVLRGATVMPMAGGQDVIRNADIVITDNRIVAVGGPLADLAAPWHSAHSSELGAAAGPMAGPHVQRQGRWRSRRRAGDE